MAAIGKPPRYITRVLCKPILQKVAQLWNVSDERTADVVLGYEGSLAALTS